MSASVWAQKFDVSGTVMDETGTSVPYAAVSVRSLTDTTFLTGSATDMDGEFTLQLPSDRYELTISFLSYQAFKQELTVDEGDVKVGTLRLKPKTELIEEVVVAGEKGQMELKLDKRVFNVSKDPSNAGSNAQEILQNVPSVDVDVDGTVNLRGSSNVRILIDGKPSGLTGISTQDALRQLPGNLIEKVEVITNASARYEAEGEAGILNIVLKKEKRVGINGAFEVNAGYPHNYGTSSNVNFRKGKVNVFTSIGAQYRKRPGSGYSFQEFFLEDTTFAYERFRQQERGGFSGNGRFGVDYFVNEKTNITASGMYSRSYNTNNASLRYIDLDENGAQTQTVTRDEDEVEEKQNVEANLNFRRWFKNKDNLLTFDFRYFISEDLEDAEQFEQGSDYVLNQRTDNTENERSMLFQTDYVHPFSENLKLEAGLRAALRRIDNDYLVESLNDTTQQWEALDEFNNRFQFEENVYAAYIMVSGKVKRLSMQGGLRAEYTDMTTTLVRTDEVNNRTYLSFFPSAHFSYELPSNNSLQLSYSRRISRPGQWTLMPFFGLTDNRNFYSGNPNVNPVFTNSAEFGHLKTWEKGSLLSSIYYRHRDGAIERISQSDSTGFIRTFPVNLSTEHATGFEFDLSYSMFKWWRIMLNTNLYYSLTDGQYEDQSFYAETFTARGRFTTKFTVWKKLNIQSSFNYRAPQVTPQGKRLSMYWWDIGLNMDVLKGRGTVTFSGRDLLNSRKRRWSIDNNELRSTNEFQWVARSFVVSFTYRLNQQKQRDGNRGGADAMDAGDM